MINIVTNFSELNKINLFKEELEGIPFINKIDTDKKTKGKEVNTKLKAFDFNRIVNSQGPVGTFIGNSIEKFIKIENKYHWIENDFFCGEVNMIKKECKCFNNNSKRPINENIYTTKDGFLVDILRKTNKKEPPNKECKCVNNNTKCSDNKIILITKDGFLFDVLKKTNKKELPNVLLDLIKSVDKNNEIDGLIHKYLIFKGSVNRKKGVQKIYITAEGKVLVHHSKVDGNDKTSSSKLKIKQAIKKEFIPQMILNKIESELYRQENKEFDIKYTLQIENIYELSSGKFFSDTGQKITFE
jgi:hypothetical protein